MAEDDFFDEEETEEDGELFEDNEKASVKDKLPKDKLEIRRRLEDRLDELRRRKDFDYGDFDVKD